MSKFKSQDQIHKKNTTLSYYQGTQNNIVTINLIKTETTFSMFRVPFTTGYHGSYNKIQNTLKKHKTREQFRENE